MRHLDIAISVRLACVRHAANVHPEPGSNSPFDFSLFRTDKAFCLVLLLGCSLLFSCSRSRLPSHSSVVKLRPVQFITARVKV